MEEEGFHSFSLAFVQFSGDNAAHSEYQSWRPMYNNPGQQRELARPYRKSLLIALLLITFSSGLLFAWINLGRGNVVVAAAELIMAAYSVVLYFNIRRTQRLELWAFAYLIPFFSVMMVALAC